MFMAVGKGDSAPSQKGIAATFPLISVSATAVSATAVSATGGGLGSWDWTERREGNLSGPHHEYSHQQQLTHSISEPQHQRTKPAADDAEFRRRNTAPKHDSLPEMRNQKLSRRVATSTVPQQHGSSTACYDHAVRRNV